MRGEGRGELAAQEVAMEVAALARVAPRTGEVRIHQAALLLERLPGTLAALEAGRISLSHARVVIEQTEQCSAETARALDAALWSRPPRDRTPTQLRETVRRLLARIDPDAVRRRPEQARRGRELRYWSDDDGATGVIQMRMPADQARGVFAVVDALARAAGDPPEGEVRTLGQKRLDVARDAILDSATARVAGDCGDGCCCRAQDSETNSTNPAGDAAEDPAEESSADQAGTPAPGRDPQRGLRDGAVSPVRTEVRVTIGWDVLAGLSQRPAELEGHGPIPAVLARRLAADPDATWRRLLTDPVTGTATHLDAHRYRPPAAMQELVRSRDLTCAAPGCRMPAARCDLDHVVPYDHGHPDGRGGAGRTREGNLRPCCRRHHRIKTLGDWTAALAPDPDGGQTPVVLWTSPSGHRWWVRSPELEPPPWERDPHLDPHLDPDTDPDTADAHLADLRSAAA
ncbi:DUF222 domain-containing protein [Actinomycetospora sp. CA-101289]|uniref:HNH endonuclease signature motif containing protein n=1 Tax=Actinomycetospora sp. CA-101289 TaxID=3239893 RepID=UPI003D99B5F3